MLEFGFEWNERQRRLYSIDYKKYNDSKIGLSWGSHCSPNACIRKFILTFRSLYIADDPASAGRGQLQSGKV